MARTHEVGVESVVGASSERPPTDLPDRLAEFTDLVATTISSTESREALARLAHEAALRRVATLVARGVAPTESSRRSRGRPAVCSAWMPWS